MNKEDNLYSIGEKLKMATTRVATYTACALSILIGTPITTLAGAITSILQQKRESETNADWNENYLQPYTSLPSTLENTIRRLYVLSGLKSGTHFLYDWSPKKLTLNEFNNLSADHKTHTWCTRAMPEA